MALRQIYAKVAEEACCIRLEWDVTGPPDRDLTIWAIKSRCGYDRMHVFECQRLGLRARQLQ